MAVLFYPESIMKRTSLFCMLCTCHAHGQSPGVPHPATDELGRVLPTHEEVGDLRPNKTVALFYWTWHVQHSQINKAFNISKIIEGHPEMVKDYKHPMWAPYTAPAEPRQHAYFWGEPLFGYYDGRDKWVIRKQLEMLGDAGVDVLFFDATNGSFTWKDGYVAVGEAIAEARADGVKVPQFAFMLNFGPQESSAVMLAELYDELYSIGRFKESWFQWNGKPVIMAYPEALKKATGSSAAKADAIRNFFTFRPPQPAYQGGPKRPDQWGWLENFPQNGYVEKSPGKYELVTVGVAQNWSEQTNALSAMSGPKIRGRSYTKADGFSRLSPDSYLHGYNFQEQWERALKIDPDIVFITGWNEWVMGRFETWQGVPNAFPDAFDLEHSRDIEPTKGGYGDNYYYQMVANIRRFKGMAAPEPASAPTTIKIDGDPSDWSAVKPGFTASKGNVQIRNGKGYLDPATGQPIHYQNNTARNDIIGAKVARDDSHIFFLVETAAPLTPHTDPNWMQLFIDLDRDKGTGWEGYEFRVDRQTAKGKATLSSSNGAWAWKDVGEVTYQRKGHHMEIAIPRALLGLQPSQKLDLEFKWIDSPVQTGDIMDVYLNGEAAPSGRFNFHYSAQ